MLTGVRVYIYIYINIYVHILAEVGVHGSFLLACCQANLIWFHQAGHPHPARDTWKSARCLAAVFPPEQIKSQMYTYIYRYIYIYNTQAGIFVLEIPPVHSGARRTALCKHMGRDAGA